MADITRIDRKGEVTLQATSAKAVPIFRNMQAGFHHFYNYNSDAFEFWIPGNEKALARFLSLVSDLSIETINETT
jgi:hypothetical protein